MAKPYNYGDYRYKVMHERIIDAQFETLENDEQFELEYNTETVYDDPCIERVREIRFE